MTIAEVARKAHIGKGTVYLYWKTKEELLLGLLSRDSLALADETIAAVTADPELARPSRLCPRMVRDAAKHPFVQALQSNDQGLLGLLAEDPRSASLLEKLGPDGVLHTILPIWRAHALARTDWPLDEQAYALHALTTGFLATTDSAGLRPRVAAPERVFARAVTALLGPEDASPDQIRAAAEAGIKHLTEARSTALDLIYQSVPA
ncbi:TetR/AcrR family transcriptional regulator [Amycolatopsis acidicola]|uniref:TetR/AcrR family transcriptional regulator n=1 Tax=Amycolatopsis acidicola TaxID=2596893 RepID=UPI001FB67AE5|nr:TetR/AcrR family transcriptional regulator [Amycolatopsis acidicola]